MFLVCHHNDDFACTMRNCFQIIPCLSLLRLLDLAFLKQSCSLIFGPAISLSHGISVLTPRHVAKFENENENYFWIMSCCVHCNCITIQEKSDGLSPSQHISTRHKTGKSLALLEHCHRFYHLCAKSASAKKKHTHIQN